MERLLITGAAGGLGSMVRRELTHLAPKYDYLIRLT